MKLNKDSFHRIVDDPSNIENLYDLQKEFADRGQIMPFTLNLLNGEGLEPVQIFGERITKDDEAGLTLIDGYEAAANNDVRILMFTKQPFKELVGNILMVLED